jgi:hypothetical protein
MTLHYRRHLLAAALWAVGGVVLVWASQNGYELRLLFIPLGSLALLLFGVLAFAAALYPLRLLLRPDPVTIGAAGLLVRTAGINGLVPWPAVESVLLATHVDPTSGNRTTRLVLVPAVGAGLGVPAEPAGDGRPSVVLLSIEDIREPAGRVAEALRRFAGPRFVEATTS